MTADTEYVPQPWSLRGQAIGATTTQPAREALSRHTYQPTHFFPRLPPASVSLSLSIQLLCLLQYLISSIQQRKKKNQKCSPASPEPSPAPNSPAPPSGPSTAIPPPAWELPCGSGSFTRRRRTVCLSQLYPSSQNSVTHKKNRTCPSRLEAPLGSLNDSHRGYENDEVVKRNKCRYMVRRQSSNNADPTRRTDNRPRRKPRAREEGDTKLNQFNSHIVCCSVDIIR